MAMPATGPGVTVAKFAMRPRAPIAVIVGVPTRVSEYAKPALLVAPAGMLSARVAAGTACPGPVNRPPEELELTVNATPPVGAGCDRVTPRPVAVTPAAGSRRPVM